jgi:cell division protein FtsZ
MSELMDPLAPKLVEPTAPASFIPNPVIAVTPEIKSVVSLELPTQPLATGSQPENNKTSAQTDVKKDEQQLELIIKNSEDLVQAEPQKIGERYLTAAELEERRIFEEQKRALEERAERLRRMSFNIQGNEHANEVENVPAYMRRKVDFTEGTSSADPYLSGYSVEEGRDENKANISTINTFLNGKKPD